MAKKPKRRERVSTKKQPRTGPVEDISKQTVQWSFELFDSAKQWHDDSYKGETFQEVAAQLRSYSQRTWGNITKDFQRDHIIFVNDIISEAQKRLQYLNLDDFDQLWSFRFKGLWRLWGVRVGRIFNAIWWDPQHKIYPT